MLCPSFVLGPRCLPGHPATSLIAEQEGGLISCALSSLVPLIAIPHPLIQSRLSIPLFFRDACENQGSGGFREFCERTGFSPPSSPLLPSSGTSLSLLFPSLVLLSPLFPQESLGYRSLLSFLRRPCFPFDYPEPGTSSSRHTRPSSPPRLTSGRASCSVFLLF
jgi:hypothetical protein